jgi:phage gp36-like protein
MEIINHFISEADVITLIKADQLEVLIRSNPINLWTVITFAQSEIEGYLRTRYDVGQIFDKRDSERDPHIVMIMCDIAVYHAYSNVAANKIPVLRQDRYDAAIAWLKMVTRGEIQPNLPLIINEEGQVNSSPMRYGGRKKSNFEY